MKILILVLVVAMLSGCGSGNSCEGVDTSQAPTSISLLELNKWEV